MLVANLLKVKVTNVLLPYGGIVGVTARSDISFSLIGAKKVSGTKYTNIN